MPYHLTRLELIPLITAFLPRTASLNYPPSLSRPTCIVTCCWCVASPGRDTLRISGLQRCNRR